jgi:hypothetical protein
LEAGLRMEKKKSFFSTSFSFIWSHGRRCGCQKEELLNDWGLGWLWRSGWGPYVWVGIWLSSQQAHPMVKKHRRFVDQPPCKLHTTELEAAVENDWSDYSTVAEFGLPKRKIVFHWQPQPRNEFHLNLWSQGYRLHVCRLKVHGPFIHFKFVLSLPGVYGLASVYSSRGWSSCAFSMLPSL